MKALLFTTLLTVCTGIASAQDYNSTYDLNSSYKIYDYNSYGLPEKVGEIQPTYNGYDLYDYNSYGLPEKIGTYQFNNNAIDIYRYDSYGMPEKLRTITY